ncbi:uncharacterized protein VTP21DRAFT_9587 [Calcarisporiella thermophila]|uniref:uncharacterized protein n=1 Tax=Calcarisporiella thermophila TaxID=911321 RepID=UPI003742CA65
MNNAEKIETTLTVSKDEPMETSEGVELERNEKEKKPFWRLAKKKEKRTAPTPVKEKTKKISYFQLYRYASWLDLLLVFLGIICSIASGIAQPLMGISFGRIVSGFSLVNMTSLDAAYKSLIDGVLLFVWFGIGLTLSMYGSMCFWTLAGEYQTKRVRELYLHAILRQDQGWFDTNEPESLTSRLAADTFLIQEGLSDKVGLVIQNISMFVSGFVIAFVNSWRLTLVVLSVVPLLGFTGFLLTVLITTGTKEGQDAYAGAGAVMEQAISGIRTVAAFSLQSRFIQQFEEKIDIAYRAGVKKAFGTGLSLGIFLLVLFSAYGLGFWYGAYLVSNQIMDGAAVVQAFFAIIVGAFSVGQIPTNYKALVEAQVAAYKIFKTIDRVPDIDSSPKALHRGKEPSTCSGNISFCNVHFSYPSRKEVPVLRGIDLEVPSGKTVALVGASGSGKSTIIQLVQRFYDPTEGEIFIDGLALKDVSVRWLRKQIGIVGQEPVLFNDTIRNNIALGSLNGDPTQDEIIEACKLANCHDLITKLPLGYDTLVGEKGSQLSGGQKQRIAIARALVRNPSILLLDEATSALDTYSERLVQDALKKASRDRSTIVIAHRLSTIKEADLIVVMDKGAIVEQGSHEELLNMQGAYYRYVVEQQLKTGGDDVTLTSEKTEEVLVEEEQQLIKQESLPPAKKILNFARQLSGRSAKDEDAAVARAASGEIDVPPEPRPVLRVIKMMKPEWGLMFISLVGSVMGGVAYPIFSLIFARLIEALSRPIDQVEPSSRFWAIIFVVIGAAMFLSSCMKEGVMLYCGERLIRRVRSICFRNLMKQEMGFFDKPAHSTGTLTARLAKEATQLHELPDALFMNAGQTVIVLVIGLVIAFVNGWKLTLILLATVPVLVLAGVFEAKAFEGFSGKTRKGYEKSGQVAGEAIREIRTVASLGVEGVFEGKYIEANAEPHRISLQKAYLASLGYAISQGFQFFVFALGFYVGIQFIRAGDMDYLQLLTTMFAVIFSAMGVGNISSSLPRVVKARQAAINIFELIDKCTLIDPDADGDTSGSAPRTAGLRNAAFAYPSRLDATIFDGVSLDVKENQKVALVGPSGCGKSTVIALLMRWYDTIAGEAHVEGVNVRRWQLGALRRRIALVGQEPVLFDMTIRENILYGREEGEAVTQEEIEEVAKQANIHSFIANLPNGYHTRVGDKGSQLSGGQKQRIAIARALLRNPEILLLDEATSALDSESEKLVQEALDNAMVGRTTVAIAHRLSSIQDSDVIIVIKEGKIVEQGNHLELVALGGVYSELVKQQDLAAVVDAI